MHTIARLTVFTCAFCHMRVQNLLKGPASTHNFSSPLATSHIFLILELKRCILYVYNCV